MKYTAALAVGLAALASAQDITIFPECSIPCIQEAIGTTSCASDDYACVCENMDSLAVEATGCVIAACGSNVGEVLTAAEEFCSQVGEGGGDEGGDDSATTITGTLTLTATETATTDAPTPTGGDDDGEDDGDDGDDDVSTVEPPATTSTSIPVPTNNGTTPPPATTSEPVTGGAAAAGYIGSLGMLALGALAAL
ncbi:hypothetical protein MMYC01_201758 [Madurella mycetomatis]|uniref:CFEM domain-containing protein n=1 Tax=Madurella mycetomatis TaxID=100816 RepID=A0A175WCK0_9PEZI|nr:hypothetical protein MMYC01_201758 [Madurella mycetomatis]